MNLNLSTTKAAPSGRAVLTAAILILVAVLAAYSNSFHANFHLDDDHQIVKNYNIKSLSNLPRFFTDARTATYLPGRMDFFRPLTTASFAINYAISGNAVCSYHVVNIALHCLNSFLAFLIIRLVLIQAGRVDAYPISLFASLAFALHPVQTDAVTYISGRAVLLASLFYLLAFYCFVRYRSAEDGRGYPWAAAAPVLYLMGLLSKEIAVSLPAMLLLYDGFFTFPKRDKYWKYALYYIPFILVLLFFLAVRKHMIGYASVPGKDYEVGYYLLSEAKVLLMYVRLLLLPMNQNFDYVLPLTQALDSKVVLSVILCLVAALFLYLARKNEPGFAFLALWFFIALAPESTFIPIKDLAVEYRLYLPSIGFIAALSILAQMFMKYESLKKGAAVIVLAMLLVLSFNRNGVFATDQTLWNDVARKSPNSARAHQALGNALLIERRYREASAELRRALELEPSDYEDPTVILDLGICCYNEGYYKDAEDAFKEVMRVYRTSMPECYYWLGRIYTETGKYQDAVDVMRKGELQNPNLDLTHFMLADLYMQKGNKADALREILEAKRCSPKDFEITLALAEIYSKNGMSDKARETAGEALGLAQDEGQRKDAQALADRLKGP